MPDQPGSLGPKCGQGAEQRPKGPLEGLLQIHGSGASKSPPFAGINSVRREAGHGKAIALSPVEGIVDQNILELHPGVEAHGVSVFDYAFLASVLIRNGYWMVNVQAEQKR